MHEILYCLLIFYGVSKDFKQQRTFSVHCHERSHTKTQFIHITRRQISYVVLFANSFCRSIMMTSHEPVKSLALVQPPQAIKYASTSIIQQQYPKITTNIRIPKSVLVIEKAKVTNYTKTILSETTEKPAATERLPSIPFTPRLHQT